MDTMTQYLIEYRYWALLVVALAEGPVASFVAGALVALGYFNPWAAFGVLAFKDLVLDSAFYAIGCLARVPFFAKRISSLRVQTGLADRVLQAIERGWRDHPVQLMWIGKLAWGLSAWFLVSAGVAGVPFRKFYLYTLPVTVFQFGGLMVLGYFLGISMWNSTSWVFVTIQLVVAAVVIFFAIRAVTHYVRRRYVETQSK